MATLLDRDSAPDSSVATTSFPRSMTPVVSGAAMPSLFACCFTFVGLDSVLCDTSRAAPDERASLIWLVSSLDCIVVDIVADMSPMRTNPTMDTTSSTTAATFARNTTLEGSVGVWVRVPRPGTTLMRSRGARSGARSG